MKRHIQRLAIATFFLISSASSFAAEGSLGARTVKSYWLEGDVFILVTPTTAFANPTGCTDSGGAIIPLSNPNYKMMLAAVIHAMTTGAPMNMYASGCFSYWGHAYPQVYALGVG